MCDIRMLRMDRELSRTNGDSRCPLPRQYPFMDSFSNTVHTDSFSNTVRPVAAGKIAEEAFDSTWRAVFVMLDEDGKGFELFAEASLPSERGRLCCSKIKSTTHSTLCSCV